MKNRMDLKGIVILICVFISFYFIASMFLDKFKRDEEITEDGNLIVDSDINYVNERDIVNNLYQDVRMLYDVVNNKFRVSQEDVIVVNNLTYKKIVNFDEVFAGKFTETGILKYIDSLKGYFAYKDGVYYLAGNLVTYQTYYFRGDNTNIYVLDAGEEVINAIIYERWTSNNKNTLATVRVVKVDGQWLIDDLSILSTQ